MRKLLGTLYVSTENAYLTLENNNIVCNVEKQQLLKIPFDNIENIVCFSYMGCSPALMGKCVENNVSLNFVSPQGKFLAKVCGGTHGNVYLRVEQIKKFKNNNILLAQNTIAAKVLNTLQLIKRSQHDNEKLRTDEDILRTVNILKVGTENVYQQKDIESIMGVEGNCARAYFSVFDKLISTYKKEFSFKERTKRPPLDPINALLSFFYTLLTNDYASALETVGLDSYIGFCHSLRSGRESLACDLVEEARCFVERLVLTLINLKIVSPTDFDYQVSGDVYLKKEARNKVIDKWQEKKREDFQHPYLNQKIPYGLVPYVQANLLAKYVRGDIDEYPPLLFKQG